MKNEPLNQNKNQLEEKITIKELLSITALIIPIGIIAFYFYEIAIKMQILLMEGEALTPEKLGVPNWNYDLLMNIFIIVSINYFVIVKGLIPFMYKMMYQEKYK